MTVDANDVLDQWREEILAESVAMQSELDEKRQALAAAEIADRAEKAKQKSLQTRIAAALDGTPPANALGVRLEGEMKDTTSGAIARLRGEIAEIERRIMDCRVAIAQLERALAPDEIMMAA
jgi:hypothetical protein